MTRFAITFARLVTGLSILLISGMWAPTHATPRHVRAARTLYVSPTGNDNGEGTLAAPYQTIRAAINTAFRGDTIMLKEGRYTGTGNQDLDFGGKSVTLSSVSGAEKTIIDCGNGISAEESPGSRRNVSEDQELHAGLLFLNKETASVSGITIRGASCAVRLDKGATLDLKRCIITENHGQRYGACGGVNNNNGMGIVRASDCIFRKNEGGGARRLTLVERCSFTDNTDGGLNGASIVRNCVFEHNSSRDGGGCTIDHGKASDCMFKYNDAESGGGCEGIDVELTRCKFIGNMARNEGGGFHGSGTLTDCTFTANLALEYGGGVMCGATEVRQSTFMNNKAHLGGGCASIYSLRTTARFGLPTRIIHCVFANNAAFSGGGLYTISSCAMTNCAFFTNQATGSGAGLYIQSTERDNSRMVLQYCTICNNRVASKDEIWNLPIEGIEESAGFDATADKFQKDILEHVNQLQEGNYLEKGGMDGGGLMSKGTATLTDCIIWGNEAPNSAGIGMGTNVRTTITYSDIQGGLSGPGNMKSDPLFVDLEHGDLHLRPGSPCIGAGIPVVDSRPFDNNNLPISRPLLRSGPGQVGTHRVQLNAKTGTTPVATDLDGKHRPAKPTQGAYEGAKPR